MNKLKQLQDKIIYSLECGSSLKNILRLIYRIPGVMIIKIEDVLGKVSLKTN